MPIVGTRSVTQAAQETRRAYLANMLANESPPGALLPMIALEMKTKKKKLSSPVAAKPPSQKIYDSPIARILAVKMDPDFDWE